MRPSLLMMFGRLIASTLGAFTLTSHIKDREGTISTPFRKIFAIICLSPVPMPGQTAVFYDGDSVTGSGIIQSVSRLSR